MLLSDGDLTARIPDTLPEDFGGLRDAFNGFMQRLDELVGKIRASMQDIASESDAIASNAKDLSVRGEMQANRLEETSSTMQRACSRLSLGAGEAKQSANASENQSLKAGRSSA